ncbi:alpha/beta hydrolase [Propylenella binzhouense]|uniref:alpha/beta hydrolase n=1 Tax=Propylenella binzhouense TaxID=2555902 RepID=UPI001FE583CB|nr:dienelactone hydrolase family protein [Propylenella binzhouense]
MNDDPHAGQPVSRAGPALSAARGAVILVHGRGSNPADMMGLARLVLPAEMAALAPRAAGSTWYPYSFMAPTDSNEPWLGSALGRIGALVAEIEAAGLPGERVAILGFSQGACLALEFAIRNPRRYGAVVALSGGLIGPEGTVWPDRGSLAGTPAFLGCSDVDFHIPLERVEASAALFRARGAEVDARIYPGMGHTVNEDEVARVRDLLSAIVAA